MKVLLELLIVGGLIFIGWSQSYSEQLQRLFGDEPPTPSPAATAPPAVEADNPAPASRPKSADSSWMWENQGKLDRRTHR